MIRLDQTWFKRIYILHIINLKEMITFLMKTHSVIMKMINQFCLIKIYTNPEKWILKNFIMNHDRQNYNHSTQFLNYLIFRKLTLFTTLLRLSLTNHIPPCNSTNHQPPTETPEPSLFYEHYREQFFVFSAHHVSLGINNRFQ